MYLGRSRAEVLTYVREKLVGSWRSGKTDWIMLYGQDFAMTIDKRYVNTSIIWRKAKLG
jgi:hypothetical protein